MWYAVTSNRARAKHIVRSAVPVCGAQAFVRLGENRPDIPVCSKCAMVFPLASDRPFLVFLAPTTAQTMTQALTESRPDLVEDLKDAHPVTSRGRRVLRIMTTAGRAQDLLEQMRALGQDA